MLPRSHSDGFQARSVKRSCKPATWSSPGSGGTPTRTGRAAAADAPTGVSGGKSRSRGQRGRGPEAEECLTLPASPTRCRAGHGFLPAWPLRQDSNGTARRDLDRELLAPSVRTAPGAGIRGSPYGLAPGPSVAGVIHVGRQVKLIAGRKVRAAQGRQDAHCTAPSRVMAAGGSRACPGRQVCGVAASSVAGAVTVGRQRRGGHGRQRECVRTGGGVSRQGRAGGPVPPG